MHKRLALHICPDRNPQVLVDAWCLEVTNDDLAFAQLGGELRGVVLRVAGENEVCRRGQNLKAKCFKIIDQYAAAVHYRVPGFFQVFLVVHGCRCAGDGDAVERVGVEAVFYAVECFDQVAVADGIADAQPGQRM